MSLNRNLTANYLGQGWSAVMSLAFIPVYIRYLGMEAYGLIGLFAVMQAWIALLDIGMTPTLAREMARFTFGAHTPQSIRNLLRTLEIACFGVAAFIAAAVWSASGWLANDWLRMSKLPIPVVAHAVATMAFVLALRFVESIYRSALIGLQKQVLYNATNAINATLRNIGVIGVMAWIQPSIQAFFAWQAIVSIVAVAALAIEVHQTLPAAPARAAFSVSSLREIWRFAGGMTGISLLAILLTQVDKVLLSRLLPLDIFGSYALATSLTGVLYLLVAPITTAVYPRLVELSSAKDELAAAALYHRAAHLVTVATAPAALLLIVFAQGAVYAWSGDVALARGVGPILSVVALGTFMNVLVNMPYQMQLAHGWIALTMRTNIVAVAFIVPSLLVVVPRFGVVGASWVWLALNVGYFVIYVQLMHRRILRGEATRWLLRDVSAPLAASVAVMLAATFLAPGALEGRGRWSAFLCTTLSLALLAAAATIPEIRSRLLGAAPLAGRSPTSP